MKRLFYFLSVLVFSLHLSGCKGLVEKFRHLSETPPAGQNVSPSDSSQSAPPANQGSLPVQSPLPPQGFIPPLPPPPPANNDEDSQLGNRLDLAIECYNKTYLKIANTRREYLYALKSAEPVCKTGHQNFPDFPLAQGGSTDPFGLYTLAQNSTNMSLYTNPCNKAAEAGVQPLASTQKLDSILKIYAPGYTDLATNIVKTRDYFVQQDYKDDQCVKGREMHARLMPLLDQLEMQANAFGTELDALKNVLDQRELLKLEKTKGKAFDWHLLNYAIQMKAVLASLHLEENGKVNPTEFSAGFALLDKAYTDLEAYLQAHPEDTSNSYFSMFSSNLKDYYVKTKLLNRAITSGQMPKANDLNDIVVTYNRYIEWSNRAKGLPRF